MTIVLNPASGQGAGRGAIESALQAAGVRARMALASHTARLQAVVREAVAAGEDAVVAAGGDGTVSTVAGILAGGNVPLGILPVGTLNHFAKDLGIPLELEAAARTLAAGHTAPVDVCEVNGRVFINNSSIGLYPFLVQQRELRRRLGAGKWPALARAACAALRWHPYLNVRIEANGKVFERTTPLVFIGNNDYAVEGFSAGSRRKLDGGVLGVYLLRDTGRLDLLRLAARAALGHLRQAPEFESLLACQVRIHSRRRRLPVAADGETLTLETPLDYRIRPRSLRVLAP